MKLRYLLIITDEINSIYNKSYIFSTLKNTINFLIDTKNTSMYSANAKYRLIYIRSYDDIDLNVL